MVQNFYSKYAYKKVVIIIVNFINSGSSNVERLMFFLLPSPLPFLKKKKNSTKLLVVVKRVT